MLGSPGSSEISTMVPSLTLKVGRLLTRTVEDEKAKRARRAMRARILKICLTDMIRRKEVLKIVEEEIGGNQGDTECREQEASISVSGISQLLGILASVLGR
jgi:hypothetical protein